MPVTPPPGFILDATQASPPPGFTLDPDVLNGTPPQPQMSAQPPSTHPVGDWLHNLDTDVTEGGNRTLPGRVLGHMQGRGDEGYSGMNSGGQASTAQFMGSPILGPIHTAQGVAETPDHPIMGPIHAAEGVMQTAAIPSAMMGGEAAEAGINAIPSRKYAGQLLDSVMEDAQHVPVNLDRTKVPLLRAIEIGERGGTPAKPVSDLWSRANDIAAPTFREARDYYTNLSQKSADEVNSLKPVMKRAIGGARDAFHQDLTDAAGTVGRGEDYIKGINEYAKASKMVDALKTAGKYAIPALLGGGAAGGAYKLIKGITGN